MPAAHVHPSVHETPCEVGKATVSGWAPRHRVWRCKKTARFNTLLRATSAPPPGTNTVRCGTDVTNPGAQTSYLDRGFYRETSAFTKNEQNLVDAASSSPARSEGGDDLHINAIPPMTRQLTLGSAPRFAIGGRASSLFLTRCGAKGNVISVS